LDGAGCGVVVRHLGHGRTSPTHRKTTRRGSAPRPRYSRTLP
jgi:hypothetical protein